jgi:hypothetical protein
MGITNPALNSSLQTLTGAQYLSRMLPNLVSILFIIGAIAFMFFMLIGAIQWISAGADKVAVEKARSRIINAFIGLVILLSLYAFINLVELFFDVNLTNIDLSNLGLLTP